MMGTARHITTRSKAFIMFIRQFTTTSPVSGLLNSDADVGTDSLLYMDRGICVLSVQV